MRQSINSFPEGKNHSPKTKPSLCTKPSIHRSRFTHTLVCKRLPNMRKYQLTVRLSHISYIVRSLAYCKPVPTHCLFFFRLREIRNNQRYHPSDVSSFVTFQRILIHCTISQWGNILLHISNILLSPNDPIASCVLNHRLVTENIFKAQNLTFAFPLRGIHSISLFAKALYVLQSPTYPES